MKKPKVLLAAFCCAWVWSVGSSLASAETKVLISQSAASQYGTYVVQPGDNLWRIADRELNDPWKWKEIKKLNPFLSEPNRMFAGEQPGELIVVIKPGEQLVGLDVIGALPRIQPFGALVIPSAYAAQKPSQDVFLGDSPKKQGGITILPVGEWSWFAWLCFAIAAITLAAFLIHRHIRALKRQDPVGSGPAMVEGGVQGGIESETAADRFQHIAAEQVRQQSGVQVSPAYFTILERTEGRGYGTMQVQYRHQPMATRILNGERVYQARVRMQDGQSERMIYMLQGCGNELRFGSVLGYIPGLNFRFEPLTQASSTETPTAPSSAAPAATATSAESPLMPPRPTALETVRFELRPAKGNKPASVNVVGTPREGTTIESHGNVIAITFGAPSAPQGQ